MFKEQENAPQMPPIPLLGGALVTATAYAFLLSTDKGREWDRDHNWFVVMLGVFMTLLWLSFCDPKAGAKAFMFFFASGLPIMARGLLQDSEERAAIKRG